MKLPLIIGTLLSTAAFAAKPESINNYLEIQTKLATDNFSGVSHLAHMIAETEKGTKAEKLAKKVADSKNIEEARKNFKNLSEDFIANTSKKDLGNLKIASCPMAKAKWIQKESEVRNPYYGSSMLECGSIE